MSKLALVALTACIATTPHKNEAVAHVGRAHWQAQVTSATFDGKLVRIALGPRIAIVIASCYAHAQQKIGDHDHVQIELDGKQPLTGELDITDCLTTHVIARVDAKFADGTRLEADLDTELAKP
ncbi:MAG TPA: hypothetical protein VGG74_08910 [Kofleriaceae bacterium]|jgi:hypothetical protein